MILFSNLLKTSLIASPVVGNSFSFRPNCLPILTNNPYRVVSFLELEYINLIGKFDFSTLSWILESTFLTTKVLPVPGFP